MTATSTEFWALAFAVGGQIAALLIWGATMTQRVRRLEQEIQPLQAMPAKIAVIETRLDTLIEQLRDLNASVRWLRDPASETTINPHRK